MAKFKPNDYYSEISPPLHGTIVAKQDGRYFDTEHEECDPSNGKRVGKKKKSKEGKSVKSEPATAESDTDPNNPTPTPSTIEPSEDRTTLLAWYEDRSVTRLPTFQVFKMVKAVYGEDTSNFGEAREVIAKAEGF